MEIYMSLVNPHNFFISYHVVVMAYSKNEDLVLLNFRKKYYRIIKWRILIYE